MSKVELDDFDRQIIERLGRDARVSNREVGRELGVTEGTIRARLKRLFEANAISVSVVCNSALLAHPILAYLFIEVDTAHNIEAVAEALASVQQISFVATLLGRSDILAMTLVENGDQVTELLHKTIDKIPGVHRVQYSLGQQFVKHDYHWSVIQPQPA